jgi:predicted transcriptional regulator
MVHFVRAIRTMSSELTIHLDEWQLGKIQAGLEDVREGRVVEHHRVEQWMRSWGKESEEPAPE